MLRLNHQMTIEEQKALYEEAEKAVFIAIRARHEKSGQQFLADLQNAQTRDKLTRDRETLRQQLDTAEKQYKQTAEEFEKLAETRNHLKAQSERVKLTDAERTEYCKLYQVEQHKGENIKHTLRTQLGQIKDTEKRLEENSTDRADLVQVAIMQMLENALHPAPVTEKLSLANPDSTAEELQSIANFKAVINAVGRAITNMASPDALNRTTTKILRKATAEDVEQFANCANGKKHVAVRRARLSDCFDTIEEREPKRGEHKGKGKGLYIVRHWVTVAPYQYIETFDNGTSNIDYVKTYNPFVSNWADLEELEELAELANLTDRERVLFNAFANRCRVESDYAKCMDFAFSVLARERGQSIKPATRRKVWQRLTDKLKARHKELKTAYKEEPKEERPTAEPKPRANSRAKGVAWVVHEEPQQSQEQAERMERAKAIAREYEQRANQSKPKQSKRQYNITADPNKIYWFENVQPQAQAEPPQQTARKHATAEQLAKARANANSLAKYNK